MRIYRNIFVTFVKRDIIDASWFSINYTIDGSFI